MSKNYMRKLSQIFSIITLCLIFACSASLADINDTLFERGTLLRGNNVPTNKINLNSNEKYVASWTKVYNYTYTNVKMCTGNPGKQFKIVLAANTAADSSTNEPVNDDMTVKMYNDSGTCVKTWTTSDTSSHKFTKYYSPSSSSTYYYFRIEHSGIGYSYGKLTITLTDK